MDVNSECLTARMDVNSECLTAIQYSNAKIELIVNKFREYLCPKSAFKTFFSNKFSWEYL